MWRLLYLCLLFVRVYFALSPSYLHPDEIFQGPEVIAGYLFNYPSQKTWEWTSDNPIRSVFPLWPVYGLPMALLKWMWVQDDNDLVDPTIIYYTLRLVMLALSFVLEDWAVHDLVRSPRHWQQAAILVSSSYVTWTFQTHTFSNSIETLAVLWSLVVIERILRENKRSAIASCIVLGFLLVFGTFNRMTFPAFVVIPGIKLLPHFLNRPFCLLALTLSGLFWTLGAIVVDTAYYCGPQATRSFSALYNHVRNNPVITPLNNLIYNSQTTNLAEHGLHPHYQHIVANAPQLLGPAFLLLLISAWPFNLRTLKTIFSNNRLASATTGTLFLSLIPHQEPRFLLPIVPLILTSIRTPIKPLANKMFWAAWWLFNMVLAILMGVHHQGGIISTQLSMRNLVTTSLNNTHSTAHNIEVFWWKTYPPPLFLLGTSGTHPSTSQPLNISTVSLMGYPQNELVFLLMQHMPTCEPSLLEKLQSFIHAEKTDIYVVAPLSAWNLSTDPDFTYPPINNFSFAIDISVPPCRLQMTNINIFRAHINLDDLSPGTEGIIPTLKRVVGRRGLGVWRADPICGTVYDGYAVGKYPKEAEPVIKSEALISAENAIATSIERAMSRALEEEAAETSSSVAMEGDGKDEL